MGKLRSVRPRGTALKPRRGRALTDQPGGRRSPDWLNTAAWQRLRLQVIARDGGICQQTGELLVGVHPAPNSPVVDHIRPHRGDPDLFWDINNLQLVSKAWHDRVKQSLEKSGKV